MYDDKFKRISEGLRLYDLLVRFQQGDNRGFELIIMRFNLFLKKASYNGDIGGHDYELQALIQYTLLHKLKRFVIPDKVVINPKPDGLAGDQFELQSAPM